jgi:hypothetical protein
MVICLVSTVNRSRLASALLVALITALRVDTADAQGIPPRDSTSLVRGQIRSSSFPIQGATVRIDTIVRVSDAEGRFVMAVARGMRLVHVTAIGFAAVDTSVIVTSDPLEFAITLRPLGVLLDSVRVTANWTAFKPARYKDTGKFDQFFARKARALGGSFFTREDIERSGKHSADDLLATVPGVRVDHLTTGNTMLRFARCGGSALLGQTGARDQSKDGFGKSETVQVFVDGMRVSEPFVTLASLTAGDVEAMEVYRGVSELPMEAAGDGCAAIFIWTRYTPGSVLPDKKANRGQP